MHATFYEPDLGDQLTAIVFLVEEQVFDTPSWSKFYSKNKATNPSNYTKTDYWYEENVLKEEWTQLVGGESNVIFKEWLSQFRLA